MTQVMNCWTQVVWWYAGESTRTMLASASADSLASGPLRDLQQVPILSCIVDPIAIYTARPTGRPPLVESL